MKEYNDNIIDKERYFAGLFFSIVPAKIREQGWIAQKVFSKIKIGIACLYASLQHVLFLWPFQRWGIRLKTNIIQCE